MTAGGALFGFSGPPLGIEPAEVRLRPVPSLVA